LHQAPPFDSSHHTLGDLLLEPTHIYTESVLPLCQQNMVKGIAHITGGGLLENIPRMLPNSSAVELDIATWQVPELFKWIQQTAQVAEKEMQRTFNLGIGMVLIVDPQKADEVLTHFDALSCTAYTIGIVTTRGKEQPHVIINGTIK
jgi:phosphoribosylaminoimidazole (AIR) synthetase